MTVKRFGKSKKKIRIIKVFGNKKKTIFST
jgi:hypothetical protein